MTFHHTQISILNNEQNDNKNHNEEKDNSINNNTNNFEFDFSLCHDTYGCCKNWYGYWH